jgi:hypothetical protein
MALAEVRSCSDRRKCRPNAAQTPKQEIHWPTIMGPSPKPAENNFDRISIGPQVLGSHRWPGSGMTNQPAGNPKFGVGDSFPRSPPKR